MTESQAYLRPSSFVSKVMNPLVSVLGVVPTLAVKGRKSGRWRTVPVNVLELDGERYLVSARGETEWVRNLRAAGGGEIRRFRRRKPFTAVELPTDQIPPLVAAYRAKWDSQVKSFYEKLPDPADHPSFRIAGG